MSSLRGYGCDGRSGRWRPPDQRRELSTGPFSWWQRQTSRPCGGLVSGGRNRWGNTHAVLVAVGSPTSVGEKQPVRQTGKKVVSERRYVKRMKPNTFNLQHCRAIGKSVSVGKLRVDDAMSDFLFCHEHENVLFFSDRGLVYSTRAYKIPECSPNVAGKPLVQILSMGEGERVASIVPVSEFAEDHYLLMLTVNGCIKTVPLKLFSRMHSSGIIAIQLKSADKLKWVRCCTSDDLLAMASQNGQVVLSTCDGVRTLSRNTKGVTAMRLKKADKMASLDTSSLRKDMVEKSEEISNENEGDASLLGRLKMGVEKQLSQYKVKAEWSIVVPPGRYVSVNPGEGNLVAITEIRFNNQHRPDNNMIYADGQAPHCQLYLGINRTHQELIIGYLNTMSQPHRELPDPLYLSEGFTIGHAGYSDICFSGFRYRKQPEPHLQPLLVEQPQLSWPFDLEVTAMIMSKFGSSARVARAERVCKLFYQAGRSPLAYENVDLSNTPAAEELTALMCMRRAAGQMRSLVIGCPRIHHNYFYTNRVLEPFQYLGKLLTKLAFFGLSHFTSSEDMLPVFAHCSALQDFEMKNASLGFQNAVPIPLVNVMQNLATHCAHLERLVYDDTAGGNLPMAVNDDILFQFVENCPAVNHLGLRGVSLSDIQVRIIFEGLCRLTSLDLSSSGGFTGISLVQVANTINDARLKVLVLQTCAHLREEHLQTFFMRLREGSYFHLHKLLVSGRVGGNLREGFEARTGVAELVTARPGIDIDINFVVLDGINQDILNHLLLGPDYVVELAPLDEDEEEEEPQVVEDLDEEDEEEPEYMEPLDEEEEEPQDMEPLDEEEEEPEYVEALDEEEPEYVEALDEEELQDLEDLDEINLVSRKRFIHCCVLHNF